jgi:hypothetical protein
VNIVSKRHYSTYRCGLEIVLRLFGQLFGALSRQLPRYGTVRVFPLNNIFQEVMCQTLVLQQYILLRCLIFILITE